MSEQSSSASIAGMHVTCAVCGGRAAMVELVPPGVTHPRAGSAALADLGIYDRPSGRGSLIQEGVTGKSMWAIDSDQLDALRAIFVRGDWRALHRLDPEWLSSYCPTCDVNYCAAHWDKFDEFDDGFYDCTRGTCPRGHRRMLAD
jgi:hypothetical protein